MDIKSGLTRNQILERYALLDNEYDRIIELLKRDLKSATVAKETHHLKKLILNVSNSCNLNCKYCYANGGVYNSAEKLMNFNTAKTAIDKFISYFGEIQQIQFFGGEPLLNYELISQCCEYIIQEQKNGRIHYIPIFGIVTNGTVINEKIINIIKKYNINITISCDGPKKINDLLRVDLNGNGTYDTISNTIRILYHENNIIPNIEVTYTQYHRNQGLNVSQLLSFFKDNFGIHNIHIVPVNIDNELAIDNYADFLESITYENIKNHDTIHKVKNIVYNLCNNCGDYKVCGAGTNVFCVNVKGDVYPCFMMNDIEGLRVTNIFNDKEHFMADIKTCQDKYDFNQKLRSPCKECFNKLLCNGCMGINVLQNGNPLHFVDKECEFLRALTEKTLIELAR